MIEFRIDVISTRTTHMSAIELGSTEPMARTRPIRSEKQSCLWGISMLIHDVVELIE